MKKPFRMLVILLVVFAAVALLASCSAPAVANNPANATAVQPAATSAPEGSPTAAPLPTPVLVASAGAPVDLPVPPVPAPTLGPYDVSVSIQYFITLDDKVKDTDPNIIRAARQGMFDYDANNAHHAHYAGYSVSYDIDIFKVDQKDAGTWDVRFHEKQTGDAGYPDGYSLVTVTKQQTGVYVGTIVNPGGPMIRGDETY